MFTWDRRIGLAGICALLLFSIAVGNLWCATTEPEEKDKDYAAVLELGGAGEWKIGSGAFHPGGSLAVEFTPIKDRLEMEVGVSASPADGGVEVPVDLLFKKPYRVSRQVEFMWGVGPEVVRVTGTDHNGVFLGGEAALDFMFWPFHGDVGLFVEPSYDFVFRNGVEHGAGGSAGILIGL